MVSQRNQNQNSNLEISGGALGDIEEDTDHRESFTLNHQKLMDKMRRSQEQSLKKVDDNSRSVNDSSLI